MIIFVPRQEILALNNLKFQCYEKFHTFQLNKIAIQTRTLCYQNIQCIFNVPQHNLLRNRNCQFEILRKRRVMDWHLLFPMSHVSSSTRDKEYCKCYLPSHTISASAGTESRGATPSTNFRAFWAGNQRERRKLPEHIQRQCNSKRDIPQVIRGFFCSA